VIVGMGAAGLDAGRVAATLGLKVAMVEQDRPGGQHLWTADRPTKALAAAARVAHLSRAATDFGLPPPSAPVDPTVVWACLRAGEANAHRADEVAPYRALGIEVVLGHGELTGPQQVTVGGTRVLEAPVILLATGSEPIVPAIDGLEGVAHLTPDDFFHLDAPPASITIVGAGPTGVELAQALQRIGVRTTLLERQSRVLPDEEPALTTRFADLLRAEGVEVLLGVEPDEVHAADRGVTVSGRRRGQVYERTSEALLFATGRRPRLDGLGLEAAGITTSPDGIPTDRRGRTNVSSVYVAGDAGQDRGTTHLARYHGLLTVRDAFFPLAGNRAEVVPWCTFTDPELARVGLTVAEAEARHGEGVDVWTLDLAQTERAHAEHARGWIVAVTAKGRLVGAHVLAPAAGEMIHELAMAVRDGVKLFDLAALPHAEPTWSAGIGRLAAEAAVERAHKLRWLARKGR
jgi:pyruvate/2-oxoglutarate dehydrogenase complex dihydrolipoamide dehydrogenase (E3) component